MIEINEEDRLANVPAHSRRKAYILYVAYKEWQEDGLLSFTTFVELMDHGVEPTELTETFNTIEDINELIEEQ